MIEVTLASVLAISIILIGERLQAGKKAFILAIGFLIIFFGIRENYGNDYPQYQEVFRYFEKDTLTEALKADVRYEYGWRILNVLFAPLGFNALIFTCTAFQFIGIGWFINKYTPEKYRWVVLAIYLFSCQLMMTELSMLRQSIAMTICLFSVPYIQKKNFIRAALLIVLAGQFHSTAYSAFLLFAIPFIRDYPSKVLIILFLLIFFAFFAIENLASDFLNLIFSSTDYGEKYGNYLAKNERGTVGTGIGTIVRVLTGIYLLKITSDHTEDQLRRFFALSYCFVVMLLPINYSVQLIARILTYFDKISIVAYYYLLDSSESKAITIGKVLFLLNMLLILSRYFAFFEDPTFTEAFSTYNTILD